MVKTLNDLSSYASHLAQVIRKLSRFQQTLSVDPQLKPIVFGPFLNLALMKAFFYTVTMISSAMQTKTKLVSHILGRHQDGSVRVQQKQLS